MKNVFRETKFQTSRQAIRSSMGLAGPDNVCFEVVNQDLWSRLCGARITWLSIIAFYENFNIHCKKRQGLRDVVQQKRFLKILASAQYTEQTS